MPSNPSHIAERLIALGVGKSCVLSVRPDPFIRTACKYVPGAVYARTAIDGRFVVTRTA